MNVVFISTKLLHFSGSDVKAAHQNNGFAMQVVEILNFSNSF